MIDPRKLFAGKLLSNALEGGAVILRSGLGETPSASGATRVHGTAQKAWSFLTDYGSHPGILRVIAMEKVLKRNGHKVELKMKFGAKLAMITLGADFSMDALEDPPHRIDFTLRDGSKTRFVGFWGAEPLGKDESAILFGIEGDIRSLGWAARLLVDRHPTLESGVLSSVVSAVLTDVEAHFAGK